MWDDTNQNKVKLVELSKLSKDYNVLNREHEITPTRISSRDKIFSIASVTRQGKTISVRHKNQRNTLSQQSLQRQHHKKTLLQFRGVKMLLVYQPANSAINQDMLDSTRCVIRCTLRRVFISQQVRTHCTCVPETWLVYNDFVSSQQLAY
jgi:hypothetical protein